MQDYDGFTHWNNLIELMWAHQLQSDKNKSNKQKQIKVLKSNEKWSEH